MNLNQLMQNGISDIVKTAGRFYLKNAKGRAFFARMAPQVIKSTAIREKHEKAGQHIPPFLIASIASQCNLHCAGCYARAGGCCSEAPPTADLTDAEWGRIFDEAAGLGISFILLAGGEPLLRRGVIDRAAACKSVVFPIFTNGTLLDEEYCALFDANRHLVPVLSVEGNETETDERRGAGVFASIRSAMSMLTQRQILFGVSITVTKENLSTVLDQAFVEDLRAKGCGALFYVEYVPTEKGTEYLSLDENDLLLLQKRTESLRQQVRDMVMLSFPGDEEAMGGCLASGRGFFHINPKGGAEPCPFSPYARHNLAQSSILQVLSSGYFDALRGLSASAGPHTGGCVLFQKENEVRALLGHS